MKIQSKLNHRISRIDGFFAESIENHVMQLVEFSHAAHVKLAYIYLTKFGYKKSLSKMTQTLKSYLAFNGVDSNKFHVTLTEGWIRTVWHFMQQSNALTSADEFLQQFPNLLNKNILLNHYSHELLFSEKARLCYIEPDLLPFPVISRP